MALVVAEALAIAAETWTVDEPVRRQYQRARYREQCWTAEPLRLGAAVLALDALARPHCGLEYSGS